VSTSAHPVRPLGYDGFSAVRWQPLFEDCDINGALSHSEIRHPFLDLRLLQFMLALPAMPWCRNKLIIRRSMRAALPNEVLRRKKATLQVSPDFQRVLTSGFPRLVLSPDLLKYANPAKIPRAPGTSLELRSALRPLGLNYWLQDLANN
jgi:asparagine synthase (glutamine-hydrolysing)